MKIATKTGGVDFMDPLQGCFFRLAPTFRGFPQCSSAAEVPNGSSGGGSPHAQDVGVSV